MDVLDYSLPSPPPSEHLKRHFLHPACHFLTRVDMEGSAQEHFILQRYQIKSFLNSLLNKTTSRKKRQKSLGYLQAK